MSAQSIANLAAYRAAHGKPPISTRIESDSVYEYKTRLASRDRELGALITDEYQLARCALEVYRTARRMGNDAGAVELARIANHHRSTARALRAIRSGGTYE